MTPIDDATPPVDHPGHDLADGPEDVLPARAPGRRAKIPEGTPSPLGRIVLPVALALVSVAAVVAAWSHLQSESAAESAAAPTVTSAASASPSPTTTPSATAPSAEPTPSATPTADVSETPSSEPPATSPAPSESSTAVVIDRSVPVTVLNGTKRTGLASKAAADLKKLGWTIVSIGNWRSGGVATTTVFVEGREDAAATMRRDLDAADATKAPIGSMRPNRITIVLMDDYPAG